VLAVARAQLNLTPNGFGAGGVSRPAVPVSDAELEKRFAELVKNVAGTNDQQRDAMMSMPAEMKWNMIMQHTKSQRSTTSSGRVEDIPENWTHRLTAEPNKKTLMELRVLLSCQPLSWLQKFIQIKGIELLVGLLGQIEKKAIHNSSEESRYRHTPDDLIIEAECVRCLRMLMNNELGLRGVCVCVCAPCCGAAVLSARTMRCAAAVLHTKDAVKNLCLALDSAAMDVRA
jgi:hypothetical protein